MKIVFDTSALISVVQKKTDVIGLLSEMQEYEDAEYIVLRESIDELMAKGKSLSSALMPYLQKHGVRVETGGKNKPDNAVLNYASIHKAVVCTNDLRLKARLKKLGIQVITLREKRFPRNFS